MRCTAPAIVGLAGLLLGGCGIKGPLYLPEKSSEVIIRPAPAAPPGDGQPPVPSQATPPEQKPAQPPADEPATPRD